MQKKISLFLFLLIITNDIVFGKHKNKTKSSNLNHKKSNEVKKPINRIKRSIDDIDKLVVPNIQNDNDDTPRNNLDKRKFYSDPKLGNDPPFWGNRGRRESSESFDNYQLPANMKHIGNIRGFKPIPFDTTQGKSESDYPFWGNRGRRDSSETTDSRLNFDEKLIKYRERKQEDEEPFWGTRGRREDEPSWGSSGRWENEPFWGNRGRREGEPFWGNRGRRDITDPFWSSHGKSEELSHYLLNDETEPFWGNRGRRKSGLKESIIEAINDVKENIDDLVKGQSGTSSSFWTNRGRDSRIKHLFDGSTRNRFLQDPNISNKKDTQHLMRPINTNTLSNDQMYAEEPHYIIVERSSRASGEIDPFYISRGKKYNSIEEAKSTRGRRGALDEIVKTVRNDPYYIARGKKSIDSVRIGNISILKDDIVKSKQLICAIMDMLARRQANKVKREIVDVNERDRRTILKKLALQLQMDPYFVSRGKKNKERTENNVGSLKKFIDHVTDMCI